MSLNRTASPVRSLLLTGDPVSIRVPNPVPGMGNGVVRATLLNKLKPLGVWEFIVEMGSPAPQVRLSPFSLDQCFITIDHPNSSPVAYRHELFAVPEEMDNLVLQLETRLTTHHSLDLYQLKWATKAASEKCLATWRQVRTPPIEWFHVELTTHCNLSCPFCPSSILKRPRAFMTLEMARRVFQQISEYRTRHASPFGYAHLNRMVFLHVMGEPLLHPKLTEIVAIARTHDIFPALFTNATFLTDRNIAKIFDSGISHVTLSINVVTATGYAELGAKGTIEDQERRVINFLRQRAEREAFNIHVDLQYIASTGRTVVGNGLLESRNQFWRLFTLWLSLTRHLEGSSGGEFDPVPAINPNALSNPLAPDTGGDTSLRFPIASGIYLVVKSGCSFGNVMLPDGLTVIPGTSGKCPFDNPNRVMCIFVDGSVSFCSLDYENSVSLGNLADQSIESLWKSERMQYIRTEMKQGHLVEPLCQRCLGKVVPKRLPVNKKENGHE